MGCWRGSLKTFLQIYTLSSWYSWENISILSKIEDLDIPLSFLASVLVYTFHRHPEYNKHIYCSPFLFHLVVCVWISYACWPFKSKWEFQCLDGFLQWLLRNIHLKIRAWYWQESEPCNSLTGIWIPSFAITIQYIIHELP